MKKILSFILSFSIFTSGVINVSALDENSRVSTEELQVQNNLMENNGIPNFMINACQKSKSFWDKKEGIFKIITDKIEQFGQIGFRLNGINYGIGSIAFFWHVIKGLYEKTKLKFSKINKNVDVVSKAFDSELQCIRGQEKAKKKMKEIIASVIDARNEANEKGIPYGKGDVIYMIGPSGVGKTFSAERLSKAIMGSSAEPIRIDSSCFEKKSEISVKQQILYMREQQKNSENSNFYYVDNSLAAKIASNPEIVLILDEYDKWCTQDSDEFLRTIMDKGIIYRDGEKINCSGILIMVLSNEDHSSISAGNNTGTFQDDGTGSRTHVVHDKSFLNRLNIIEFDNLNEKAYEEIAQAQLEKIADRYSKLYSVNLDFGDTAKKIAIKTAHTNQGAREIEKILAGLKTEIIITRQNAQKSFNNFKNKVFTVNYNLENDVFTLKEKTSDGTSIKSEKDINITPQISSDIDVTNTLPEKTSYDIISEPVSSECTTTVNSEKNQEKDICNNIKNSDYSNKVIYNDYGIEENNLSSEIKINDDYLETAVG